MSEEQAGGRYIDRLSNYSLEGLRRLRGIWEAALAELGRLNRASLQDQDAVTYDVVTTALRDNVDSANFETGGGAQAPYTVTQLTGAYTSIPDFLASQHPVTNREQADAYLARLSAYARVLDQETARIGEDAAAGVIPPDFIIDGALRQLSGFTVTAPAQTVLVTSLKSRLASVTEIADADKTALTQRAEAIARDEVLPAYRRQIEALNAIKPRATHDAGVWKLPRGEELYATALRTYTTTNMSPDEILQLGTELVSSLNAEMDAILRGQGMTSGSLTERLNALSRRPDQIYPNTEAGRTRLLADLNAQVQAIRARMPEVCGTLARADLEIKRVPEFTEAGAPGGYYQPGALDGSRPGAYYINLRNPAEECPSSRCQRSPITRASRATIGRSRLRKNRDRSRSSVVQSFCSPLMPKVGLFTPSNSPTRWACTPTIRSASSAICNQPHSAPRGLLSTRACTSSAGLASERSNPWWRQPGIRSPTLSPR